MHTITMLSPQHGIYPQEVPLTMQIINTPGLRTLDIAEIQRDLKELIRKGNSTLLCCFSMSPYTSLSEIDVTIITSLYHAFGREVWSKCVLLFTFSDDTYLEFEDSPAEYVHHINEHAQKFNNILQDISRKKSSVKSIFEYESPNALSEEVKPSDVIAIPVKRMVAQSKDILPGMIVPWQDWTDVVFVELMKRIDCTQRKSLVLFKYPRILIQSLSTIQLQEWHNMQLEQ